MHLRLGRVISEDAVNHDRLFLRAEPAVFAPEARGGLGGRGRHVEDREDADREGDGALDEEEISGMEKRAESADVANSRDGAAGDGSD